MTTTTTTRTAPRRRKGEGSVARFHNHPTCPPVGPDGERPEHKCKGPYRARTWVVAVSGERVRKTVYGATEREVLHKLKGLTVAEGTGKVVASKAPTVGSWFNPDAEELGLTNYWSQVSPTWGTETARGYASMIRTWITPELGDVRLDKLTPANVAALYAKMRKAGRSSARIHGVHTLLRPGLQLAVRQGKVAANVADMVPAPVRDSEARDSMTLGDAKAVLEAAGQDPRWWVALFQGLRQGEALGLHWGDVHLDAEVPYLFVRLSATRVPGQGMDLKAPKTKSSVREVPLLPQVVSRLRVVRAKAFLKGATNDSLVFPTNRGTIKDPKVDHTAWKKLLQRAGVEAVSLHSARNTTASLLEDAGVSDRVVAEILGHANVKMTHHYQSKNTRGRVEGMKALGSYLEDAGVA